ncbi:helix-turn-helix domain-containing protein [Alteromonas aestuariivivens]|uniref:Helix-turn-helix domain-containing protein n=1 Tax=Alteromonas aestuariivivens TaxID=1938339 RepID=A0A3D8M6A9_9ALTE|nr:helix-turn-helix domain-containing protein [Alteromonas aestuariivivens]RDV25138.1 helix-turn-helix domain-containing protein [Alteromonas aestuariivivens]
MKINGLFWSAIVRALLSMRRDMGIDNDQDIQAIEALPKIEQEQLSAADLDGLLFLLCPQALQSEFAKKLSCYLDFNRMGNTTLYFTALKDVSECLQELAAYGDSLFGESCEFHFDRCDENTVLEWRSSQSPLSQVLKCYFLLCLFRHLAGHKFDVHALGVANDITPCPHPILSVLSSGVQAPNEKWSLTISNKWLSRPSFYYSAKLKSMLKPEYKASEQPSLQKALMAVFSEAQSPARIRADWAAERLQMSESVFRRSLRQEKLSFSALLKDFIHDKSCKMLLCGEKVDTIAQDLGFSDRRSLDRSFKDHTGISAGQLRMLGSRLRFRRGNDKLLELVEHFPPLPTTIQALINLPEEHTTLEQVSELVRQDPIFHAHIMSKASRAIYGQTPKNLEQAIGRNLGLQTVKHLALVFAAQQILTQQCRFEQVNTLTDSMLLSERLYSKAFSYRQINSDEKEWVQQALLFGMLSVFLVFHEDCAFADGAIKLWNQTESFASFVSQLNELYGVCLYGATTLMLMRWGYDSVLNQQLWKLCQHPTSSAEQTIERQIQLCHQVAFTELAFMPTHQQLQPQLEPVRELPSEQRRCISETLESWRTVA